MAKPKFGISSIAAAFLFLSVLALAARLTAAELRYSVRWIRHNEGKSIMLPVHEVQRAMPLAYGNLVVAAGPGGTVQAYKQDRGDKVWSTQLGGSVEADLARDAQRLYAGTVSGAIFALDPVTGAVQWRYYTGHEILGRPVRLKDQLLFTTANNQLYAVKAATGGWVWQYNGGDDPDLSIRGVAGIALNGNDAYTGFSNGSVVRLDTVTGKPVWTQRWREESRFNDVDATPVLLNDKIYVVVYGSRLLCLRAADGSLVWSAMVQAHQAPETGEGKVFIGGLDGKLRAYQAETGTLVWTKNLATGALNSPRLQGDSVVVTDGEKGLTVVDAATGETKFKYVGATTGYSAPPLVLDQGRIFAISNLGYLYRIESFSGAR